ncbi:MAG: hypothetical protein BJ554DRAFT_8428 [Olpidium bornovanus]|uniref:Uncharacterized protein n=1 Tax=Olpidium bornovanus TaxID=278681 RepID=A0A8H7ZUN7_9FUNG|nr:MAG: hypothetical protein BJ554DRAFT_8428 [Olpidium bornovanus]
MGKKPWTSSSTDFKVKWPHYGKAMLQAAVHGLRLAVPQIRRFVVEQRGRGLPLLPEQRAGRAEAQGGTLRAAGASPFSPSPPSVPSFRRTPLDPQVPRRTAANVGGIRRHREAARKSRRLCPMPNGCAPATNTRETTGKIRRWLWRHSSTEDVRCPFWFSRAAKNWQGQRRPSWPDTFVASLWLSG